MGSTKNKNLATLSKAIWEWCEDRNIFLFASYIKSMDNKADYESRYSEIETEYSLCDKAFKTITERLGKPSIDLFASYLNTKCQYYVSWRPDPGSVAVDAFSISWSDLKFYAFPPFPLILKVIKKLIFDRAEGIVVVPLWMNQPWYPLFVECLTQTPIYFTPEPDLLLSPFRESHPIWRNIILVVGKLSGKLTGNKGSPKKQSPLL